MCVCACVREQSGASVNLANVQGNTALHEAVRRGHQLLVELLLRGGASPSLRNRKQRTPLDCAYEMGGKVGGAGLLPGRRGSSVCLCARVCVCRTRRSSGLCRRPRVCLLTTSPSSCCRCPKELWVTSAANHIPPCRSCDRPTATHAVLSRLQLTPSSSGCRTRPAAGDRSWPRPPAGIHQSRHTSPSPV